MAISYSLELVTPLPTAAVAEEFAEVARSLRLFDASTTADQLLDDGAVTAYGTWTRVVTRKPTPWGDQLLGGRAFTPTVSVAFRLGKDDDIAGQQDDMARLAVALLSRVPGDAALHLDYEDVWLVRLDGELILSERSDWWPPNRLAEVPGPYRRETHEFTDPED
ncbi:SitI3 family protein [Kitasatospora sp. NPDC127111]|uniref:SitI3 family protein n=1 Tax=Kitasatospora sp. NPDC127111 TaxID=3345363 RepID=UPI003624D843